MSREVHPLNLAPAEYLTCTCLLARAFHLSGEPESSIQALRCMGICICYGCSAFVVAEGINAV